MKKIVFFLLVALSFSGFVSAPVALAMGLFIALIIQNPYPEKSAKFSKSVLQWSVVGLGFGLSLEKVVTAGADGFWITTVSIFGTLFAGYALGKFLKVERNTSLLVSSGTAICGGSAIAATGSVLKADSRAMSVSLGIIFILNAIALFVFPPIGEWLELTQHQFGLWSAIAIHDTSSVVGAASGYGHTALDVAITVKLLRTLWIIPLVIVLALLFNRPFRFEKFPWFILYFLLAVMISTLFPAGAPVYSLLREISVMGLTLSLFLIGAGLSKEALKSVGFAPFIQGTVLWVFISISSLLAVLSFY